LTVGEGIKSVVFWALTCVRKHFVRAQLFKEYWAQRNPMFVFVFVGALFKFRQKAPSFVPLFQLPPRMKPRFRF